MHFLQAINSDLSVLIVCNKTGGTIKRRYKKYIQSVTGGTDPTWRGCSYVKLYRKTPKHLYPKFNVYGDIGQRKVWTSLVSAHSTLCDVLLSVSGGWGTGPVYFNCIPTLSLDTADDLG